MKKSVIVLSGLILLTSLVAAAGTPPATTGATPVRTAPGAGDTSHAATTPVEAMPNTAYEQAVTAYMNNVLIMARKRHEPAAAERPGRRAGAAAGGTTHVSANVPPPVNVADLPQVEAIMIGRRATARLMSASGGLLIVGVRDVTRYGTVTRIDSTGVWLRPAGFSHPILLEDLTPSEMAAENGSGPAGAMNPYGAGAPIATPPIPISPSMSRLPSGVRRN